MKVYNHIVVADRAGALEAVPDITGSGDREAESLKATGTCDDTPHMVLFPGKSDKQNDKRVGVSSQVITQVITPHRTKDGGRLIVSPQARAVKP